MGYRSSWFIYSLFAGHLVWSVHHCGILCVGCFVIYLHFTVAILVFVMPDGFFFNSTFMGFWVLLLWVVCIIFIVCFFVLMSLMFDVYNLVLLKQDWIMVRYHMPLDIKMGQLTVTKLLELRLWCTVTDTFFQEVLPTEEMMDTSVC